MKTFGWIRVALLCMAGAFVFAACDDDGDDGAAHVPDAVREAFAGQYAGVEHVD